MNPETAIAPTPIVRRRNARKWHLLRTVGRVKDGNETPDVTRCGQRIRIRNSAHGRAFNAEQITCNDCLVAAISEGRP